MKIKKYAKYENMKKFENIENLKILKFENIQNLKILKIRNFAILNRIYILLCLNFMIGFAKFQFYKLKISA